MFRCKCRTIFCFSCGQEWHEPVNCDMLKKWLKKCSDDSETSNWLNANTKDCPQCHTTIEKDGGCNHVTCKSAACRFEFCWTCLGAWKPHGSGWYSCNRMFNQRFNELFKLIFRIWWHWCKEGTWWTGKKSRCIAKIPPLLQSLHKSQKQLETREKGLFLNKFKTFKFNYF